MTGVVLRNSYQILDGAWRRRYAIVLPMLLMPVLGLVVGLLSPRSYETSMSFLVQDAAKLNPFLTDFSMATNLEERMEAINTLLHSRHVLLDVVLELGLAEKKDSDYDKDAAMRKLSDSITARLLGTEMVRISYRSASPDGMDAVLQKVGDRFIGILLAPEQSSIEASEDFLAEQIKSQRGELVTAERRLAEFKSLHVDKLPSLHQGNVTQLREENEAWSGKGIELAGARAALDGLRSRLAQTNPVVGRLEEQIVTMRSELALLRSRYTEGHSAVQAVMRKLENVEAERKRYIRDAPKVSEEDMQRLWNLANWASVGDGESGTQPLLVSQLQELESAATRVRQLEQETTSLGASVTRLTTNLQSFGETERELQELERDLKVRRKIYEDLLTRHEMARVTGALGRFEQPERIKLIDRPNRPSAPVTPTLLLFVLAGLLGGVALGAGLGLSQELSDTSVRYRHRLEALTGAPVLARIPALAAVVQGGALIESTSMEEVWR